MSNASDKTSCISHKPITHYFVMYEDFLEVAKVSEHQNKLAAFWRVLETKTNDRMTYNEKLIEDAKTRGLPAPETSLWIEIPYSEFVKRSLGVYKSSSFQIAAAESERLGFHKSRTLTRKRNSLDPDSPPEDYKEYLFLTGIMQKALNEGEYPTPIEINSPLLKSIAARKEEKRKRAIEKNTPPIDFNSPQPSTPIEINTPAIEINRIIESTVLPSKDNKDKDTENASSDAPPHASLSCALCSESEDLAHCDTCKTLLCFEHRRDFPVEGRITEIYCLSCMDEKHSHHLTERDNTTTIQEDALPQSPAIALQSSSLPLTVQEASVNGALPKIEAESDLEPSPIALETTNEQPPERKPRKPKRTDEVAAWYTAISGWFPKYLPAEYDDNFCLPQTKRRTEAIVSLLEAKVSLEDAEFVFKDICKDTDPFWKKHRDITAVNSQFSSRISKKPKTIRTAQSNGSSPQQQESFRVLKQVEVMILPLEERKEYNRRYREWKKQQDEQEASTSHNARSAS